MIFDCFTFFNELDLLEIRLNVLCQHVDHFVLVEANRTHTGIAKPFVFEENRSRFAPFLDKIIHIKVDDFPELEASESGNFGNRWIFENYQRDAILRGLSQCQDEDIVLISDVDEIPNPEAIKKYRKGICCLEQKFMYYFLNNRCLREPTWSKARICRYVDLLHPKQKLKKHDPYAFSAPGRPTYLRFCKARTIAHGGWHFSYCGGVESILQKRRSIVEQQYNTDDNMRPEAVLEAVQQGKDILGRPGFRFETVPIDASFPRYIVENQDRYQQIICTHTPKNRPWKMLFARLGFGAKAY